MKVCCVWLRATWKHAVSRCTKTRSEGIWRSVWVRSQPWRSAKATIETTKQLFAFCRGFIILLLLCSRGKNGAAFVSYWKERPLSIYKNWYFSFLRPKEFIECVSHIRQLSWLLLGSLTHSALHQGSTSCMPIPMDAGCHIADHLIVILIGFPEQSKV